MELLIQKLSDTGELAHVIYAILGVIVVAIIRGVVIKSGEKSISFGKDKNEKN